MSAPQPASLETNLVNLVIALLTPMFLWATEGDIRLARIAAAQTVTAFGVANDLNLFTVAKIIAFDIAALSSLSLSMYEEISMLLGLRLRGNAVSLDRASARNRAVLEQERRTDKAVETGDAVDAAIAEAQRMVQEAKARVQAAIAPATAPVARAQPKAEPAPAAEPAKVAEPVAVAAAAPEAPAAATRTPAQQRQSAWAQAMTMVADEFTAGLKDLPQEERWKKMARIEALTVAAADLASGTARTAFPGMAAEQTGARTPGLSAGSENIREFRASR
nr:hypothetical protein [uncultured Rhodopila sp.]